MSVIGIDEFIGGIYGIFGPTSKWYVGSSPIIRNRFYNHRTTLNRNIHYNSLLQLDWNKFGEARFNFKVLEELDLPKDMLLDREQQWLDMYWNDLYNECPDARSVTGYNKKQVVLSDGQVFKDYNAFAMACGYSSTEAVLTLLRKGRTLDYIAEIRGVKIGKKTIVLSNGMAFKDTAAFARACGYTHQWSISQQLYAGKDYEYIARTRGLIGG
jgi:group I intron endonuclease